MSEWRPVVGYEGLYEVGNRGEVRSLSRMSRNQWGEFWLEGRPIRPSINTTGRLAVSLTRNGKAKTWPVHRLVALAFLGEGCEGEVICHNNGDCLDNRVENLRWDTRAANAVDSVNHGTHHESKVTHCPKGHEYAGENVRIVGGSRRACRTCGREYSRWYEANRRTRV